MAKLSVLPRSAPSLRVLRAARLRDTVPNTCSGSGGRAPHAPFPWTLSWYLPSLMYTISLSGPGLRQRGHPGSFHVLLGLGSCSVGDQAPRALLAE